MSTSTTDRVFWRAADQVLVTARLAGLDTRPLISGLAFEASPPAARWIPWGDYCTLLERLEAACGGEPDALERLTLQNVAFNEVKAFAGAFVNPTQLYAFLFRVIDPLCFPCIRFGFLELEDGRVRIDAELKVGVRGCLALMRASVGAIRAVPTHLGLPPAEVEAELSEFRGVFFVRPPVSQTIFARARRRSTAAIDSLTALLGEISSEQAPAGASIITLDPRTSVADAPPDGALHGFRSIHGLSDRQFEVLREIIAGCTNKDIASHLGCAESTVELHVTKLLRKVGVQSRAQLISKCWTHTEATAR